ncbi:MAG: biopolymer transporter ExbD [Halobacteriovoraceae bacterium]|nr:biopolymer transporter ExbD [Halobacteriovoraceae bacterium]
MLRAPSRRKRKEPPQRLNLIPILDAVFIFIFFLLMSANFIKIFEVQSDVPIISDSPPPKSKKKPLALTLKATSTGLNIYTGVPSRLVKKISKTSTGDYDFETLHSFMLSMKMRNKSERSIILEPRVDVEYEIIVKIMDAVRLFRNTDDKIFIKDKDGLDTPAKYLFDQIVFGNIRS